MIWSIRITLISWLILKFYFIVVGQIGYWWRKQSFVFHLYHWLIWESVIKLCVESFKFSWILIGIERLLKEQIPIDYWWRSHILSIRWYRLISYKFRSHFITSFGLIKLHLSFHLIKLWKLKLKIYFITFNHQHSLFILD